MNAIYIAPEPPTGYLIDGTPVFALRDVAATYGMTYAECEIALREFIGCTGLPRAEKAALLAGVMRAGDRRIHRIQ